MQPTTDMEVEFDKEQCKAVQDGVGQNAVYLFACHVQWNNFADLKAYKVLITALNSNDKRCGRLPKPTAPEVSVPNRCSEYILKAKSMGEEHRRCLSWDRTRRRCFS